MSRAEEGSLDYSNTSTTLSIVQSDGWGAKAPAAGQAKDTTMGEGVAAGVADTWEKEKLSSLLEAGKAAIARSRYVFGAINIAVIIILSAEFNALWPWVRYSVGRIPDKELNNEITKNILDLNSVSIPVIGLKFSTSDLSVVAAIGMALLTLWLYYSARRENHVIYNIVSEARAAIKNNNEEKARYLYHGITHYLVFSTVTSKHPSRAFGDFVLRCMLYAPWWALILIIFTDVKSLFSGPIIVQDNNIGLCELGTSERIEIGCRWIFCGVLAAFCFVQCRECEILEISSQDDLDEIRAVVDPGWRKSARRLVPKRLWREGWVPRAMTFVISLFAAALLFTLGLRLLRLAAPPFYLTCPQASAFSPESLISLACLLVGTLVLGASAIVPSWLFPGRRPTDT